MNGRTLVTDLTYSIQPKSDQLNADDLIGTNRTLVVTGVDANRTPDQPVVIHYEGGDGRPYKPCKSMRRVLIHAWGADGSQWVGRAMTVYRDDSVKWAGEEVGGIRISHLSHIDRPITIALTQTRGKRKKTTIHPLRIDTSKTGDPLQEHRNALSLAVAGGVMALKEAWLKVPKDLQPRLKDHKDQCKAQIDSANAPEPEPEQQGFVPASAPQQAEPEPQPEPEPPQGDTDIENL